MSILEIIFCMLTLITSIGLIYGFYKIITDKKIVVKNAYEGFYGEWI